MLAEQEIKKVCKRKLEWVRYPACLCLLPTLTAA